MGRERWGRPWPRLPPGAAALRPRTDRAAGRTKGSARALHLQQSVGVCALNQEGTHGLALFDSGCKAHTSPWEESASRFDFSW